MMSLRALALLLILPLHLMGQAPVAVNDTIHVYRGVSITIQAKSNDYDPDGGPLAIETVLYSGSGTAENYGGFNIKYTSSTNFTGTEIITYVVCDDDVPKLCDTGLVVVHVLDSSILINDFIDINNVSAVVNSNGMLFYDYNYANGGFEVPKGSGKNTIFVGQLWMTSVDQFGQRYGAYAFYGAKNDFWPGPIMNTESQGLAQDTLWNRVWNLKQSDIDYHISNWNQSGYIPIKDIKDWPAHGDVALGQDFYLAPFKDVNANGLYDPGNGDYPFIKGDQMAYFLFNDGKYGHEYGGLAMKMEVHGMLYSFDCPNDSALHNSVFLNYRMVNRSSRTYYDCYLGQFSDLDIGNPLDDYIECDVKRSSFFAFDADSSSAQGVTVLAGPLLEPDMKDDASNICNESLNGYGFGDGKIDNERYGLTGFNYMWGNQGGGDYYQLLHGKMLDGTTMRYGGVGHINNCTSCEYTRYLFPGNSDSCGWGVCDDPELLSCGTVPGDPTPWTMQSAGMVPNEIRGVGSIGPFTVEPNEELEVDLVFVHGNDYDFTDNKNRSIDIMKERIDSIRSYFYGNHNPCGGILLSEKPPEENSSNPHLNLYPNPVESYLRIENLENAGNREYQIYDLTGRQVQSGYIHVDEGIIAESLPSGIFILNIRHKAELYWAKFVKL